MSDIYMKPAEVADRLCVDVVTVHNMIRDGRLTAHRLGPKTVRVLKASLPAAYEVSDLWRTRKAVFRVLNKAIRDGTVEATRQINNVSIQLACIEDDVFRSAWISTDGAQHRLNQLAALLEVISLTFPQYAELCDKCAIEGALRCS